MTTLALHPASPLRAPFAFNWPRVSAYSGSLAFHIALALALLAPPVAMELRRVAEDKAIIVTPPREEAKPVAEPVLPVPDHHKRKPVAAPPIPSITITRPESFAVAPPQNTIAPPGEASTPTADGAGAGVADSAPSALAYKNRTAIPYPRISLQRREQGTVMLHVLVGADGLVQQIEISKSSGSRELDNAARDAVRHWSFQPGTHGGVPYAAWALVPISFSLP